MLFADIFFKCNRLKIFLFFFRAGTQPVLKKVYDLEGLLLGLESHLIGKQHDFTPDTKAMSYLNKSVYDYEKNTRYVV